MKKPGKTVTGLTLVTEDEQPELNRDRLLYDFDIDDAALKSEHIKALDEMLDFMLKRLQATADKRRPFWTVNIDGYASKTGTAAHNQTLSEHRERSVHQYLLRRLNEREFAVLAAAAVKFNTSFHGFNDTVVAGENPTGRSVRVAIVPPGVVPGPITPPSEPVVNNGARRVSVWINAFIPKNVSGVTHPVNNGPFKGSTFVFGPLVPSGLFPPPPPVNPFLQNPVQPIPAFPPSVPALFRPAFLTNNRDFVAKDDRSLSFFKMHAGAVIDFSTNTPMVVEKSLLGGESIMIEPVTGAEIKRGVSSASNMFIRPAPVVSLNPFLPLSSKSFALRFELAAAIPLVPLANFVGNIDLVGTMTIDAQARLLIFDGFIDDFPVFECYVSADDGAPKAVFQINPIKGLTPMNLPGPANQKVGPIVMSF